MKLFRKTLQAAALVTAAMLSLAAPAHAQHAGYRTLTVAGDRPTTVALFYPTAAAERTLPMGPWLPIVAPGAPASDAKLKGLILISHGTGCTELNHPNTTNEIQQSSTRASAEKLVRRKGAGQYSHLAQPRSGGGRWR